MSEGTLHGTPFVTGPMLLAALGLLAWDWLSVRVYRVGAACLLLFFGAVRGFATVPAIVLIGVGGVMGLAAARWFVRLPRAASAS